MDHEQGGAGAVREVALQVLPEPVVALVLGLPARLGGLYRAQRVEDDEGVLVAVLLEPAGEDVGEDVGSGIRVEVEAGWQGGAAREGPAAGLEAPVAVLQGQVQYRPCCHVHAAQGGATGRRCQGQGQGEPGLADLGRADQEAVPLGNDAGHDPLQGRELLRVEPGRGADAGHGPPPGLRVVEQGGPVLVLPRAPQVGDGAVGGVAGGGGVVAEGVEVLAGVGPAHAIPLSARRRRARSARSGSPRRSHSSA